MLNELREWEMSLNNENLFDINAALNEVVWEHEATFTVPEIDYSELEIFDSVSLNFGIPLDVSLFTSAGLQITSVDELMNPALVWTDETNYPGMNHEYGVDLADHLDNVSIAYADMSLAKADLLTALQGVNRNTVDLLDPTRAYMDIPQIKDYHISQLFTYEGVDLDSYDTVSIKMPDASPIPVGSSPDWPTIFAEIERYVQNFLTEDISDIVVNDVHYKPSRSGMTLVRGTGHAKSRSLFSGFEQGYAETQNIFSFNESREAYGPGKPFNIPMQLYIENGELIFKVNLSGIDLRYLQELNHFPREMNMKSVLSLIPRKKAK